MYYYASCTNIIIGQNQVDARECQPCDASIGCPGRSVGLIASFLCFFIGFVSKTIRIFTSVTRDLSIGFVWPSLVLRPCSLLVDGEATRSILH